MKLAKILLLDLNPATSLGDALRDILESRADRDGFEFTHSRGGDSGPGPAALSKPLLSTNPGLIFLVPPEVPHGETRELFRSLECECLKAPVVVVSDTGGTEEMFEWLRLGAADFITLPLKTDAERAAGSFLARWLGFAPRTEVFVSEYGCRCPLVRGERGEEAAAALRRAARFLEQSGAFYAQSAGESAVRALIV